MAGERFLAPTGGSRSSQAKLYSLTDAWWAMGSQGNVSSCVHYKAVRSVRARSTGCTLCVATGDRWVQLRMCLTCGQVACCDNSRNRHALKHYEETDHPIVTSREPGETWLWCYVEERRV